MMRGGPVCDPAGRYGSHCVKVIAIDGPAGSGKSTVAKRLAERLGLEYLDTGAMYRAVTFAVLSRGLDPADAGPVADVARAVALEMNRNQVCVDGVDATIEIRDPEVSRAVSIVAANSAVRDELRQRQREWVQQRGGAVVEGRDIGTVVIPEATLKVYLTATPEVRAARRAAEITGLNYETVAADMVRRDTLDQGRDDSPLRPAADAVEVDTTDLGVDDIVDMLVRRLSG
jgi:CMP/dCMP kinase